MTFPPRITHKLAMLFLIAVMVGGLGQAQSKHKPDVPAATNQQEPAAVSRVKVILEKGWPEVEITSTRPLTPTITKLENPLRLVIDLDNARISVKHKRVDVKSEDIGAVRLAQYPMTDMTPPVVRVVVELLKPLSYTWDVAGNRLMVRLHAEEKEATATPPTVPALTRSHEPVAVPVSPTTSGSLVFAEKLASGASVTAGADTTTLRLARGGEIHICPGTTVSVTRSQNGPDLMVGMSTGAVETHYTLENAADVIQTPDFRILLRGPGEFHYAISADSRGNTCMRGLPGNTAPAIVSELMGDGTYQLEPSEGLVFHSGHIDAADTALHPARGVVTALPEDCGCPPPPIPVMLASASATPIDSDQLRSVHLAQPNEDPRPIPPGAASGNTDPNSVSTLQVAPGSETARLPPPKPNEVRVHLEAPIVYRAATTPPPPKPPAIADAQNLPLASSAPPAPLARAAVPPAPPVEPQSKPPHRGFFGKVKGFVSSIFR